MSQQPIVISQVLSERKLTLIELHLQELLRRVRESDGELDLQIRNGYFNIYYKGNSLAKIEPQPDKQAFKVSVNKAFGFPEVLESISPKLPPKDASIRREKDYDVATVTAVMAYRLLQSKVISGLMSAIKGRAFGEEITFEQTLITDNLGRRDLIIIDRQSQPLGRIGGKLDLLSLEQQPSGRYRFLVLEVKLGDNKELSDSVAEQLHGYISLIEQHITSYAACYQENYAQKRRLGVLGETGWPEQIEIEGPVEGGLVVGFYSIQAKKKLDELHAKHPERLNGIRKFWFRNRLELEGIYKFD